MARDPAYDLSRGFTSPCDWAASFAKNESQALAGFGVARKFQSSRLQQQPLPLRSIFTDSTVPTLARLANSPATRDDGANEICARNGAPSSANPQDPIDGLDLGQRPEATSESGWTAYLDISVDWNAYNSLSRHLIRPGSIDGGGSMEDEWREDSSMESDASSGPEQPELLRKEGLRRNALRGKRKSAAVRETNPCCVVREGDNDLDDTCQSNLSCESVSDDPRPARRRCKRSRVGDDHQPALSRPPQVVDEHSDENEVEVEAGEAEISSPPSVNIHEKAVDSRLELLQHLIPHSSRQLDEEQVLEVAIDYVKSLEEEIKMFGASKDGLSSEQSASAGDSAMTSQSCQAASALQDKGICMFPLSMVVATTT
ncbi:transcription factor BHLH089 [Selaginella moellendorffii]|uniref:transcription factor BHLH089 n=1 Tax=Selaginella moellendorffii TaxID=88036 RepID=UPI000D1CE818|nr:transcription factor BHLH089 [Selaginella moellendorffii]|eukprot:XP_024528710.1 transcription factor BHLH089 [Selaginella moellendorffii]